MTRLEKIQTFLKSIDKIDNLDLPYFADESQTCFDDLFESISEGGGFNVEIIYYSTAMEYLTMHDTSLKRSLEIAANYNCDIKNLSSEDLASFLAAEIVREEFSGLKAEINAFFEELNEEEAEEE